ncbi:MAG: trehalose-phosphatase [Chloroflexi bacterium]|nr:trehalose-phosphatase [Chloroflexota bacterium]OJV92491.1 MAG: trehalose-phosphatase [Chloroflexi bacterium 54-19]
MLESIEDTEVFQRIVAAVRAGNAGLASDIDGTLSPIAPTPSESFVPEEVRTGLEKLYSTGKFKLMALVSGRSPLDGRGLVKMPQMLYLGNHGMERLEPDAANPVPARAVVKYQPMVAAALDLVRQNLLTHSPQDFGFPADAGPEWVNSLLFEDKGLTASIHYRLCPVPELARQTTLDEIRAATVNTGLIITEGRQVLEIRPPVEINKGTALTDLALEFGLESLIFMGDDLTDVDGFLALRKLEMVGGSFKQGFAIGVTSPEMNPKVRETADTLVEGVGGVAAFLERLYRHLQE